MRLALKAVRGQVAAIPWVMFFITALLTAVGAVSPAAVAIIAPIALTFAARHGINPLLMGMMVIHGAQGGGFSPISVYGVTVNEIVETEGLPDSSLAVFLGALFFNIAIAVVLFLVLGGRKLIGRKVSVAEDVREEAHAGQVTGSGPEVKGHGAAPGPAVGGGDGDRERRQPAAERRPPPCRRAREGSQTRLQAALERKRRGILRQALFQQLIERALLVRELGAGGARREVLVDARARVRVFIGKHFFSYRYDYRHEWLALTRHLEVETYTWQALPPELRPSTRAQLADGIAAAQEPLVDPEVGLHVRPRLGVG